MLLSLLLLVAAPHRISPITSFVPLLSLLSLNLVPIFITDRSTCKYAVSLTARYVHQCVRDAKNGTIRIALRTCHVWVVLISSPLNLSIVRMGEGAAIYVLWLVIRRGYCLGEFLSMDKCVVNSESIQ